MPASLRSESPAYAASEARRGKAARRDASSSGGPNCIRGKGQWYANSCAGQAQDSNPEGDVYVCRWILKNNGLATCSKWVDPTYRANEAPLAHGAEQVFSHEGPKLALMQHACLHQIPELGTTAKPWSCV